MKKIRNFTLLLATCLFISSCCVLKLKDNCGCTAIKGAEKIVEKVVGITEEVTAQKSRGLAVTSRTNVQFSNLSLEEEMMFSTIEDISFIDIPNVKENFFGKVINKVKEFCEINTREDISNEVRKILTQGGKSITILEYKDGKIKATSLVGNFSDELIKKLSEQDIINIMKDKMSN